MDESKLSAQKRRTNKIIQDSFIDLLLEYPFRKITVSMLCEKADINKTTFYAYYLDLYDLMDTLSEKLFKRLFVDIATKQDPANPNRINPIENFVREAVTVMKNNFKLCKVIFCYSENNAFLDRFFNEYKTYTMRTKKKTYARQKEAELYVNHIFYGSIGVCRAWLLSDCELSEDIIVDMETNNLLYGLKKLVSYK